MKIKKLFILGFKSFFDRLEITFPMGISGVVGPNGCGKSNIVDAIRWCMGEQSPKLLRGRRMEDVIFNGAGTVKPLGMAEVSIVFENGDGSFPPAFAQDEEMSVTRRLYRSGESEYLINKVPCRLKDIQEIFMDTGLGNRAYSIIGQGQIGNIIEQKPEETRIMLEEAAGITKYRKRVEASYRKIELAEVNLRRVEDISDEVLRQMRSLKRQAAKARRYKSIGEEIQNLELKLYSNSYHQLKMELGTKLRSNDDFIQQEIAKSTKLSEMNARIQTMNIELEEKDASLSGLRKSDSDLKEIVHKKESSLEALDGAIKMQEEMERRLSGEKEAIKERLTQLDEDRKKIQDKRKEIEESSRVLEGEISLKEKRVKTKREFLDEIKEEYEEARKELNAGENKEFGLTNESGYLNKMLNQITDSRVRLEKELQDVTEKMEHVTAVSRKKNLAREETSEKLNEIEAAIAEQKEAGEDLERMRTKVETELKAEEADWNICQSRLASLQALTDNFEGYKMGVRTIMKSADLESLRKGRILGLLADIIQVDPVYEQAVEVVLADKLQYIIVKSHEDGKEAVDYLKNRAKGRSSFIPLEKMKENRKDLTGEKDFQILSDLINVPEQYRAMIDCLLGDTVLAENLDSAISAWENLGESSGRKGKDLCFVTVEGDMVDHRGVISGGKLARSSGGLLARKREMAELKEKSAGHRKKIEDLKDKHDKIVAEIEEKKESLNGLTEDRWNCQDDINEFDKALFRFAQELDQMEKLSQRVSRDLERNEKEQDKHKKDLLRIEDELKQRRAKRQEEEEYFRKKEEELKESEQEFEAFRDDLTKSQADQRIFQEEQRGLAREMERLEDFVDESEKRQKKIEEEIAEGRGRREEHLMEKEALKEDLDKLYVRLKASEDAVNQAERERMASYDRIREEESTMEQVRREIEDLKETINRAKMEHSEIRFKMDNLAEKVSEKSGRNLSDIFEQYIDEDFSAQEMEAQLNHKKVLREKLGDVNLTAIKEHEALKERYEFIKGQREDLLNSIESLRIAIRKINRTSLEKYKRTFEEVDSKLKKIFPILFNGGAAALRMIDEERPLESGVLVEVRPPGKKLSHMGLLSGGEKALVAMALLFAIYMIKPSPFCLLDEVDAPLDEANIDRFNRLLEEIKRTSQIIMVTHSRRTMEITDRLYGVTMEKAGVSKIVSVDIQGMKEKVAANPPDVHPSYN